ncbi:hypothetical protein ACFV4K_16605 [Nocardia sp. NPDC059764]|uniref:hypothetical protein n=1 Tax=Nocardia sp. NPDC059764 TaxID=3346939 RepID=UPI003652D60E
MSIRRTTSVLVGLALATVSVPAAAEAPVPDALAKSCGFEFTWTTEHPAAVSLMRAAYELAAPGPRQYGEFTPMAG